VLINPNNPTGAVYPKDFLEQVLQLARDHNLIIFSDEIYDKILYDGAVHTSIATLADDVFCLTFGGLSKNHLVSGFRAGWMVLSGPKHLATEYVAALDMLSSMRLCANVPCQHAIQAALSGYQSVNELTVPGGRLYDQMDLTWRLLNDIPGISCVRAKGSMYMFPKMDIKKFNIHNDEQFVLDFLNEKKILLVHGRGFNYRSPDHLRVVFLPPAEQLQSAIGSLGQFLSTYKQ
jgi:alanine-synthesizing transaminase